MSSQLITSPNTAPSNAPPSTAVPDMAEQKDNKDLLAVALPLGIALLLLCVIAWPMLLWWNWEYTKPESYYQHGYFIPFLVGIMFWHRRKALQAVEKKPCWAALFVLLPCLILLVVAIKTEMQAVMSTAFLGTLTSAVWFALGTRFLRVAAFPLAFLWLMAPLPGPVLNDATLNMQSMSTSGATKLLQLAAFHPVREGNVIHLEDFTLNVDVPCSGFKLLLMLLTFNLAFANLTDTTLARRIGLFLFSLPLGLFCNAVRIALVGIVGACLGSTAAHVFHDWSGILSLILCMAALFGVAKAIGCRTFAGQPIF